MINFWRMPVFTCLIATATMANAGEWSFTGNLNIPKRGYEAALLTDGRVLIAGGLGDGSGYEIFDPSTGTWTRRSTPVTNTSHTVALLLPSAEVLYVALSQAFLYNPLADAWRNSTISISWSEYASATLLKNGNPLLMYNCQQSKIYDHQSDALINAGSSASWHETGVEVLLPDGRVFVIGFGTPCDFYDPGSNQWSVAPSMSYPRQRFVGVLLPAPWNAVLVAGQGSYGGPECELYDIVLNSWSRTGDLNSAQRRATAMVLLPSGKPLIIGGDYSNLCELYDPATGQWSTQGNLMKPHAHFSAVVLATGKVLAIAGMNGGGTNHDKCELYDSHNATWTEGPYLNSKREAHTTTPLPIIHTTNCSTNVLIVGGSSLTGTLKSCELYNYVEQRVTTTGNLNVARSNHTAILLDSGRVLIAGGKDSDIALRSCEIYDPRTQMFSSTGDMVEPRFNHTATLLQNGEDVLVTGGTNVSGDCESSCEMFTNNVWSASTSMNTARAYHAAVFLLDGRILVAGGVGPGGLLDSCEIWDPGTGNWDNTGCLGTARCYHTAVLLQSGRVLVIGGKGSAGAIATCEIYNPATGNWSAEADLNNARFLHNSTLLYSGLVLATGGYDGAGCLSSCEILDPATHEWQITESLNTPRGYHSSVLVPGDKPYVITSGGENNGQLLNSIETYDIGLGYMNQWQSEVTNYQSVVSLSDSMHIEGKLFRGVSEADGGNHCHVVSSDHPIISLVRIGGGNFQGNGGGDILYMPRSSGWSEIHTDIHPPANAAKGSYRLWSIVNGIPSKWYSTCVAVEEDTKSKVQGARCRVYPNPSTSGSGVRFRLGLSTVDRGPLTITIYDLSGRLVHSCLVDDSRLTIHGLGAGIYFYNISCHSELVSESHTITGKFTVLE